MNSATVFQLLGGLGLFLYGIKIMGESLQDLAGDRMRQLIGSLTRTPLRGVLVGTLVTMLLQSSSGTTVMTVSFVHVGLMTLKQALGVIMGANVGTTVTAQLIAFKIKDYALPIIGLGMMLAVFGRSKKQKYVGNGMVGFGLLFLGMQNMEGSMNFLREHQDLFLAFAHNPLLGVLAGALLTMVVQSSSATVGLTIAMASQGLLSLPAAIPILIGDNLGTTITAVLASLGSGRAAKQAALGHVLFNFFGGIFALLVLPLFTHVVSLSSDNIARQLANAHTLFNVGNTLIFLPFTNYFVKLIQKILPPDESSVLRGPLYLDPLLIKAAPAAAVDAVRKEVVLMGRSTQSMLRDVHTAFVENDLRMIVQVNGTEKVVNDLNHEINRYAGELWQANLSEDLSTVLASYVNGVGDLERVGDHAQNLIELYEYKRENRIVFSEKAMAEFEDMMGCATKALDLAVEAMEEENEEKARIVIDRLEAEIDMKEKDLRRRHIRRLNEGRCEPGAGVVFIDILSNLERIGDHAHNLSYIVIDVMRVRRGEKR